MSEVPLFPTVNMSLTESVIRQLLKARGAVACLVVLKAVPNGTNVLISDHNKPMDVIEVSGPDFEAALNSLPRPYITTAQLMRACLEGNS